MADTGWQYPGSTLGRNTTQPGVNKYTFSNTDNVQDNDGNLSGAVGPKFPGSDPGDGPELVVYNFGFNIPSGAIITGVEAKIEGYTDTNRVGEIAYLSIDAVGEGYGSPNGPSTPLGTVKRDDWTDMPTSSPPGEHTYGSSTDTWGASLTPEIVNGTEFGWILMVYDDVAPLQMQVDYMQMRVHYELASTPPIIMMIGA